MGLVGPLLRLMVLSFPAVAVVLALMYMDDLIYAHPVLGFGLLAAFLVGLKLVAHIQRKLRSIDA